MLVQMHFIFVTEASTIRCSQGGCGNEALCQASASTVVHHCRERACIWVSSTSLSQEVATQKVRFLSTTTFVVQNNKEHAWDGLYETGVGHRLTHFAHVDKDRSSHGDLGFRVSAGN